MMETPPFLTPDNNPPESKCVIAVCGGLNMNMTTITNRIPAAGETLNANEFDMTAGGKGGNTCVALMRLSHICPKEGEEDQPFIPMYAEAGIHGVEVQMIGSVGDDAFGKQMKEELQNQHHVNVDGVRVIPNKRSAVGVITVESDKGENRILVYPGANHARDASDFTTVQGFGNLRPDLVISQLELARPSVIQLIETAKECGIDVLLNPAPAHWLPDDVYDGLMHLVLNETEAGILTGRRVEDLLADDFDWNTVTDFFIERGVKYVVVTLGSKGAFFSSRIGQGEQVPALHVETVVDSAGAGDTFMGAYAVHWVKDKHIGKFDLKSTVEYACKASARTIQGIGCQRSIPWASDLSPKNSPVSSPELRTLTPEKRLSSITSIGTGSPEILKTDKSSALVFLANDDATRAG